jgi:hypothetical protein
MLIYVHASATYELPSESFVMLMVEPALRAPDHQVKEARLVTSDAPYCVLGTDLAGNVQRRIAAPAGEFRYEYTATIEAERNVLVPPDAEIHRHQDLPPESRTSIGASWHRARSRSPSAAPASLPTSPWPHWN